MPLSKTKDILTHATANKYGVLASVTFNFETVKWTIAAAEREQMPVIILFYPGFASHIPQHIMASMAVELAKKAAVPVAVHLDHATSFDIAINGIKDGFPSIMVDGSALPYQENVELTTAVIRTARVFGVDVEAELGRVGSGSKLEDMTNQDLFTDPSKAREFVEATGCDALAIAIGNAHGMYVQEPNLDFNRIKAIRSAVDIPLVMHGSSGIPEEQIKEAVNQGLSKFNLGTEYFRAQYNALKAGTESEAGNAFGLMKSLEEPMVDFLRSKIQLLNPNGRTICTT